jgi:predicted Zn-dependent protease
MSRLSVLLSITLAFLWFFPSISVGSVDNKLPDLGSSARVGFSTDVEETLSLRFIASLYRYTDINTDPELNDYITDIGQRLLRHVRTNRHFQFFLINDDNINAFAGPGGVIGVNTGLLMSAKTEDEIAAVLAHEIQHVEQEHLSRMFEQQRQGTAPTVASALAGLLVGSLNPAAGMAIMTGGIAYQLEQELRFSRDHEWEADRIGIETLAQAGYDPNAMADFFFTLSDRYRSGAKGSELLQTHPVTEKRISDSRAKARQMKRKQVKQSALALTLAQARLEALSARPSSQTDPQVLCYQTGLSQWLRSTVKQDMVPTCQLPTHLWSSLLRLQMSAPSQMTKLEWQKYLQLYPQQFSLWLGYADYLLDQGHSAEVIDLLLAQQEHYSFSFAFWERLSKAYYLQGDEPSSAWALSRGYGMIGQFMLSNTQLKRAQQFVKMSANPLLAVWLESQANWLENKEKNKDLLE